MLPIPISPSEVKQIARLPKYKGQEFLARKLHLAPINEEDDLKSALLVDYFYDVLQYAVNRGMPWKEVVTSLSFASDIISSAQGQKLTGMVKVLRNTAHNYVTDNKLKLQNAKLLSQYMTTTFLAHFKLYQYVLTQWQEENRGHISLTVEVPPDLMKLADADTLQVWEYANKMHEIDVDEDERKTDLEKHRIEIDSKKHEMEENMRNQFLEGQIQSISLTDAEKLISNVASTKLSFVQEDIGLDITELRDLTDIALARQAIPVPPEWKNSQVFIKNTPNPKLSGESRKSSSKSTSQKKK